MDRVDATKKDLIKFNQFWLSKLKSEANITVPKRPVARLEWAQSHVIL